MVTQFKASPVDFFLAQPINGWLAVTLYWSPLLLCALGYTLRTAQNYRRDLAKRDSGDAYYPTDTIGVLIGRAAVSVLPIANLWAAAFDVAPKLFSRFFNFVGRVFDQPLVPKRPKDEQ